MTHSDTRVTEQAPLGGTVSGAPSNPVPKARRDRRAIRSRLLGFGILPMAAMAGSLLLIPLVTRDAGPIGWGAIATGQALGAVAATVVQFGWAVMGPPQVSSVHERRAHGIYFTSIVMRGTVLVATVPVTLATLALLVPGEWFVLSACLCVAVALSGMSSAWFFIGRGEPRALLTLEVGPRLIGTALSAVVLAAGGGVAVYGVIAITTEVLIALLVVVVTGKPDQRFRVHASDARRAAKEQWTLTLSALLSLGYQRAAVPLVAGANAGAAPLYATADRVQAYARLPLGPVVQALQKWVYDGRVSEDGHDFARRARTAVLLLVVVSVALAALTVAVLPAASSLVFGDALRLDVLAAVPIGISVVAVGASLGLTTFVLVPHDRIRVVTLSGIGASLVCAPAIWLTAASGGAVGALWVVAGAEVGVAVVQALASRSLLRV